MGSELYPYKVIPPGGVLIAVQGVLDKLANLCFAQGTNAWTDVDHTAYTISTVDAHIRLFVLIVEGWKRGIPENSPCVFGSPHLPNFDGLCLPHGGDTMLHCD